METSSTTSKKPDFRGPSRFKQNNRFKKNFGSIQEGHGLAFVQKNQIKYNYLREKQRQRQNEKTTTNEDSKEKEKERENEKITIISNEDSKDFSKEKDIKGAASSSLIPGYDREVFDALPSRKRKMSKFNKAKLQYDEIIEKKNEKRNEAEIKRKLIEDKRRKYRENKLKRNKVFSQKTKKGQPLMRPRMELLLQEIEASIANDKL